MWMKVEAQVRQRVHLDSGLGQAMNAYSSPSKSACRFRDMSLLCLGDRVLTKRYVVGIASSFRGSQSCSVGGSPKLNCLEQAAGGLREEMNFEIDETRMIMVAMLVCLFAVGMAALLNYFKYREHGPTGYHARG